MDYTRLSELLQAGQWKEANQETWNIVRQVAGELQVNLDPKSFKDFPCEVISDINKLWFQYSNGNFGFSVQREIWLEVGSPSGQEDISWDRFTDRVGWQGRHIDASGSPWVGQPTALCAEIKPKFLLGAALSAAPNKNFVPHALAKRSIFSLQAPVWHLRSRLHCLPRTIEM